jgi:hypothetical protein
MKMTRAHWQMLERLFVADTESRILQTKSSTVIKDLERDGQAQRLVGSLGGGPLTLKIEGWGITPRGHILYCEWAAAQPSEPDPDRPEATHTAPPRRPS